MEFVAWVPVIVGVVALLGQLILRQLPDKAKREPAWKELSDENRELRGEVDDLRDKVATLSNQFETHKRTTTRKIDALLSLNRTLLVSWPESYQLPHPDVSVLEALEDTDIPALYARFRPGYGTA